MGTENKTTDNTEEADGVDVARVSAMGATEDEGETKPMED